MHSLTVTVPVSPRAPSPPGTHPVLTPPSSSSFSQFPEGFDPLGFASRADAQELIKFREAELKHGRVAMLAVPGFLLR